MNLQRQKEALSALRAEVQDNLDLLRSNLQSFSNSDETGSESDIPTHDADAGSVVFDRERDDSMLLDFEGRLEEIDRALEKIEEGTYGICDRDGKEITEERLIAMPEATLCIECQSLEEGL
jgi:DnaK suppressor protein